MKIQFSFFCGLLLSLFVTVGAKAQTVNDVKTPQSTPTVDQILDRYVEATGGVTAYRKLTSGVMKTTLVVEGADVTCPSVKGARHEFTILATA